MQKSNPRTEVHNECNFTTEFPTNLKNVQIERKSETLAMLQIQSLVSSISEMIEMLILNGINDTI